LRITKFEKLHLAIQLLGASKSAAEIIHQLESERVEADPSNLVYGESGIYYISPEGVLVKVILHLTDYKLDHGGKSGNINKYINNDQFDSPQVLEDIHKYHLINCSTLQLAKSQGWRGRYSMSRRTDGSFFYRYLKNNKVFKEIDYQKLNICGNCLKEINTLTHPIKHTKNNFDPAYFFDNSLFDNQNINKDSSVQYSDSIPPNIYPKDWKEISKRYRENVGYQCEDFNCSHSDLSEPELRKYLDCHHKDRDKSNISAANLIALCVLCHSRQPQHNHMAGDPRVKEYKQILINRGIKLSH